ncbi:IPTL-CTERM sorting domain-containing protein [Comamonas sp. 4034]|uniref:IPTL-CTERM sorting domain-containing protein n=1 Tax=Comamonas sp. 4034 TaxID=3156455 RepID=UPI003D21BF05
MVTPAANPGVVLDPATGQVTTTAAVPPGTYTITYELCDSANPTVCQVTTATVTVTPAVNPQPDSGTTPAGTAATPIANVRVNDTVNGQPATAANSTLRVVTPAANPGVVLDPATGQVTTTAAVPPGTYTITYELCDRLTPATCVNNTATVTVTPAVGPQPDSGTTPAGTAATPIANVRVNDTVNGQPATATNSTLRVVTPAANPGVVLDPATGQVTTTAAVPPGTYTITYELCDRLTPATCVNNTVTVTVTPAVGPQPDSGTTPAGTAATPIANVRVNDTVNGQPATATNSTITVGTDSATQAAAAQGVVLDPATGSVTTTARTPAGTYTLTYTLCDTASPAVCQVTTVTVNVTASAGNGVTSVPTLSEYGLLILAAMMGLLGWQQSRRRQRM